VGKKAIVDRDENWFLGGSGGWSGVWTKISRCLWAGGFGRVILAMAVIYNNQGHFSSLC
jgi:hypothetical protein